MTTPHPAATRRAMILAAAERLFADYGLQKTTVAGIAREASVAVGSVYLEFSSKTLIMHELSRSKYRQVLRVMRRAAMSTGSYTERFERMMSERTRAFMEIACCYPHGNELLHASCDGVNQAREMFMHEQRELLSDFLTSATEDGEFAIKDMERTIQSITLAYAHFAPPYLASIPVDHIMPALMGMHELVRSGISK